MTRSVTLKPPIALPPCVGGDPPVFTTVASAAASTGVPAGDGDVYRVVALPVAQRPPLMVGRRWRSPARAGQRIARPFASHRAAAGVGDGSPVEDGEVALRGHAGVRENVLDVRPGVVVGEDRVVQVAI